MPPIHRIGNAGNAIGHVPAEGNFERQSFVQASVVLWAVIQFIRIFGDPIHQHHSECFRQSCDFKHSVFLGHA